MKLEQLFENDDERSPEDVIQDWLDKLILFHRSTINHDLTVSVTGDVTFGARPGLTECPIKFRQVSGNFICGTKFTSLRNCPDWVGGNFVAMSCPITSLEGSPQEVGGTVYVSDTKITSLAGLPKKALALRCLQTDGTILDLKGFHKTHKDLVLKDGLVLPVTAINILGLALIPGINKVTLGASMEIDLSHHDIHQFQEQLLDIGAKAQARL